MREIKFRGKINFYDIWLEGSLMTYENFGYTVCEIITCPPPDFSSENVKPETIGQYTGLKDRNGREIYEGDILHDHFCNNRYVVHFDSGSFDVRSALDKSGNYLSDVVGDVEVIGNIHDNPELMK